MSDQQLHDLIRSVNQISINNLHYGDQQEAAEIVAIHLARFWTSRMRQQVMAYAEADGARLSEVSKLAITQLASSQEG